MSASEKLTKLEEKGRSVNFVENEAKSSAKLETIASETCIRPRFASHTLSSLMKRRTPIDPRKKSSSSMRCANASKRSQIIVYSKLSGIYKRRSVTKQSKSMQALMTILKREKRDQKRDRASASHRDSESGSTRTVCECAENSLVFLPSDLIKDVSRDLKKCAASPAKTMIVHDEPRMIFDRLKKRAEDSHAHFQEKMGHMDSCLFQCLQSNSENIRDNIASIEDRTIVDIARQSRLSDEEKEFTNSKHREVKVLHRRSRSRKPEEKLVEAFSNEDCSAVETQSESVSASVNDATTNRKYTLRRGNRKTWMIRKPETRYVDIDRTYNANLQGIRNSKLMRHVDNSQDKDDRSVVNCAVPARKKGAFQKNPVFNNQRVGRPPGVSTTRSSITKSTMSMLTQPVSQKWSRSTERSIASTENKYSSIEHVEILNSEDTSISVNRSKVLMKENRDPRANHATKICEHLVEATAEQRQRTQSGGTIPKRRRSTTKRNDANPTRSKSRSKSKSRHWQTVTSSESSRNWNEQYRTESTVIYSRRSRPSEVIHALKEIINNVREDEDVEKSAVNVSNNDVFNNKEDDNELQELPNCDISAGMSQNDEIYFTKNKHFNEPNQPCDQSVCKSINTQTEESLDSKEVLKLTQIAKQTNCNVIEAGCQTRHYNAICKNAEISCDLINSTNSKADIDSTAIEDKTPTLEDVPLHTESIKCAENRSTEDEYSDKSKKLLVSECKQTLTTETLKLDYDVMETPAKTANNFIRDEEEIMDENSQTFVQLSKNSDDKINIDIDTHQESIKYSNDSGDNSFSEKSPRPSSSIYDYDASCSSEELAEYLENDVQYGDIAKTELKTENIPSDMIATLELAAERARNLRKAIIIYYENLIPGRAEKRDEETAEDYETVARCASFPSCEIRNRERSEYDAKYCRFDATKSEDIDRFSACSSKSSNSVRMCEPALQKLSLADYCELLNEEEETVILPREKAIAKSSLNERSDLAEVKSLMQLIRRTQEEYALEMLQSEEDKNDGEDFEATGAIKTLALPMTIEKTSIISRENLLPLIYCILCSVVFWYLQFSFRCDPAT